MWNVALIGIVYIDEKRVKVNEKIEEEQKKR